VREKYFGHRNRENRKRRCIFAAVILKTKIMETAVLDKPLNSAQILILQTFARIDSEEEKNDIQALLLDYFQKRVDSQAKKINFSNEQIEDILTSHYRTPYK
jgi:hypothetical protein